MSGQIYGFGYDASMTGQALRALPGGFLATAPWAFTQIARGYGGHVTIGAFSTPITGGGAGTILDQDQPEGIISVASGYALVPLRIDVQVSVNAGATAPADNDEVEILLAVDRAAAWAGDGTVTTESVYNLRTDLSTTLSGITAASAATANITNPTLTLELAHKLDRWTNNTDVGHDRLSYNLLYEPSAPPIIVGPAALYVYWGGTVAHDGFAQVQFLSIPSTEFTTLTT